MPPAGRAGTLPPVRVAPASATASADACAAEGRGVDGGRGGKISGVFGSIIEMRGPWERVTDARAPVLKALFCGRSRAAAPADSRQLGRASCRERVCQYV